MMFFLELEKKLGFIWILPKSAYMLCCVIQTPPCCYISAYYTYISSRRRGKIVTVGTVPIGLHFTEVK